jgi:hypothetical protein
MGVGVEGQFSVSSSLWTWTCAAALLELISFTLLGTRAPDFTGLLRPDATPLRCRAPRVPTKSVGVLENPALSACRTYCLNVLRSGELTGSLLRRGRLLGGEGVTARMVECDVDGRVGEDGGGAARGRGRKCVLTFLLRWWRRLVRGLLGLRRGADLGSGFVVLY